MPEEFLPVPAEGSALFVDMNSFFASVEQEMHPELRGRPVGVCPFIHDATCIIAASTEAKARGVRTGTRISEAKRLCPGITLIANHSQAYRAYHYRIMELLENTRCQVRVRSIDEAYLGVPTDLRLQVIPLALQIKNDMAKIGSQLTCSIGIAPNLFLAKLATNLQKPNGLVEIRQQDLEGLYATLSLQELPGIARRMEQRLSLMGIESALALYHAPYQLLHTQLGQPGAAWYLRLRGYETDLRPTQHRMVGHQTTIHPQPARSRKELLGLASQLSYKTAARLRQGGLSAQTVVVQLRFTDRSRFVRRRRGHEPFFDSAALWQAVEQLIPAHLHKPVRLIGISTLDLMPTSSTTLRLWNEPQERSEHLSQAADLIEQRFGHGSIRPASHLLGPSASDQVGFGNAPRMLADQASALRATKIIRSDSGRQGAPLKLP